MEFSGTNSRLKTPHIAAALTALGIVALILLGAALAGGYLERRCVHVLAPILFPEKSQGIALQRIAFDQSDLLPLYGSSELVKPADNKAADFFRSYPTGFNVFSIFVDHVAEARRRRVRSSWKKSGDFDFADLVFSRRRPGQLLQR
jgi:hypothetical protein